MLDFSFGFALQKARISVYILNMCCCVLEALPRQRITTTRCSRIEVRVPSYAVGAIIGPKGTNIREVRICCTITILSSAYNASDIAHLISSAFNVSNIAQ